MVEPPLLIMLIGQHTNMSSSSITSAKDQRTLTSTALSRGQAGIVPPQATRMVTRLSTGGHHPPCLCVTVSESVSISENDASESGKRTFIDNSNSSSRNNIYISSSSTITTTTSHKWLIIALPRSTTDSQQKQKVGLRVKNHTRGHLLPTMPNLEPRCLLPLKAQVAECCHL